MLPSAVEYLLTLKDQSGNSVCSPRQFQVIVPNFPPRGNVIYTVAPPTPVRAYILYEFCFGEAMVPHAFNVRITHGPAQVLNAIISGMYTTSRSGIFTVLGKQQSALNVTVSNLTQLVQYYELTTQFLTVITEDNYKTVLDALRRMYTSASSENLAAQGLSLLKQMSPGSRPPIPGGLR